MTNESNDTPAGSAEPQESLPMSPVAGTELTPTPEADASPSGGEVGAVSSDAAQPSEAATSGQRRLIGSQRQQHATATAAPATASESTETSVETESDTTSDTSPADQPAESDSDDAALAAAAAGGQPAKGKVDVPNLREELAPELQAELDQAMGAGSIEQVMSPSESEVSGELEPQTTVIGTVVSIRQEDVFVDVGARNQGTIPLKQFGSTPGEGTKLEVTVQKFDASEGLYQLAIPGTATAVADWSEVEEGQIVDATVTGTNKGGLEVRVSHLRGFVPASQCSLYHIADLSEFVGQKLTCLVTEVKPKRRRLVLSRRSVLETEREAARKELLANMKPGDLRDGVVRQLRDFGAFVDIGGIDGMVHVSQIGWERVNKPSDVLEQGQAVKVKVLKISAESGKISLSIRDAIENPWTAAEKTYHSGAVVEGKVSKITDFGAFVRLEAGIEGLIHISELDHKRVFRVNDVLSEDQTVEVKVLSFDGDKQRIGLSLKALQARPERPKKKHEEDHSEADTRPRPSTKNLKGGIGGPSGGSTFGLKW
jgi:predicted RNA-binding protein with RPS1 domain